MLEKRKWWIDTLLYVSIPLIMMIVGLILVFSKSETQATTVSNIGGALLYNWATVLFGLVYFFAHIYLEDRGTLYRILSVAGIVVNVLGFIISAVFSLGILEDGGVTIPLIGIDGFGLCLVYGLFLTPIFWWMFARKVFVYLDENSYDDISSLKIIGIYTAICYVLAALSAMFGPLWGIMLAFAAVTIVCFYLEGEIGSVAKFVTNLVYYIAILVIGIVVSSSLLEAYAQQSGALVGDVQAAIIAGWVTVAFSFFFFLCWDFCAERGCRFPSSHTVFKLIGAISTVVVGAIALGMLIANSPIILPGIESFELRSSFKNVFANAFYYTPVVILMFRWIVYMIGYKKDWGEFVELTVLLAFPFAAYVASVIFLLVGFIYVLIAYALVLLVLFLIEKFKLDRHFASLSSSSSGFSGGGSSATFGGKKMGLSSKADCPGLGNRLKSWIPAYSIRGNGWSLATNYSLHVDYNDSTKHIEVRARIKYRKGDHEPSTSEVESVIAEKIEGIISDYQRDNPETSGVVFSVEYTIQFEEA